MQPQCCPPQCRSRLPRRSPPPRQAESWRLLHLLLSPRAPGLQPQVGSHPPPLRPLLVRQAPARPSGWARPQQRCPQQRWAPRKVSCQLDSLWTPRGPRGLADQRAWAPSQGLPQAGGGQSPGPADWPAPRMAPGPQTWQQQQRRKAVSIQRKHTTHTHSRRPCSGTCPLTHRAVPSSPDTGTRPHPHKPGTHLSHPQQANYLPDQRQAPPRSLAGLCPTGYRGACAFLLPAPQTLKTSPCPPEVQVTDQAGHDHT